MATQKINCTKNYRLFRRSDDNRPTDIGARKKLIDSMRKYGFLSCFPIVCRRNAKKELIIKDGQHRFAAAESLALPVYWVEEEQDFDIATINATSRVWVIKDYARMFAGNGKESYQEGMDFAEEHGIPIGIAFALLGGNTKFSNVQAPFISGNFVVKDRAWADKVAHLYSETIKLSKNVRSARFLEACMAVCRVPQFDADRFLESAQRCRDRLVSYSTRDAYLSVMEEIYNFAKHNLFPLKNEALMVMRSRNIVRRNGRP